MVRGREMVKLKNIKLRKLYISKYKMFRDFSIDFVDNNDNTLPIILLAGINGSGKTSLLEYIIDKENFKDRSSFLEVEDMEGRIYSTKDFDFPIDVIYAKTNLTIDTIKEILPKYIENMVYKDNILPFDAYKKFRDEMKLIFDGLDMEIEFDNRDGEGNLFFKNGNGEIFSIDTISTGEKTLLSKILYLYIEKIENQTILIDEPELSLHPSWQNKILKIYENFAIQNKCQIIIATHSPHIIGGAKGEYIRLLVKEGNKIDIVDNIDRSYGLKFDKILTDIMGVENLRTPEIAKDIERLWELLKDENYNTQEYIELYSRLEKLLGSLDKDMLLARLEIAKIKSRDAKSK
jgi:predicted ATP-binding protein involved in virulence